MYVLNEAAIQIGRGSLFIVSNMHIHSLMIYSLRRRDLGAVADDLIQVFH